MPPFILSRDFVPDEFIAFIDQHHFPETALIMAFSPSETVLETWSNSISIESFSENGRVFWPEGELKWRKIDGMIRAVYLGSEPFTDKMEDYSSEWKDLKCQPHEFILWGERSDTEYEWLEQQVPHRFNYPIDGKKYSMGRIALVIENWTDPSGFVLFSRYHSLKEIPGEPYADK